MPKPSERIEEIKNDLKNKLSKKTGIPLIPGDFCNDQAIIQFLDEQYKESNE